MDNEYCFLNWSGGFEHFWSVPNERGEQECLFCCERRTLVIRDEQLPNQVANQEAKA
jgi:hypothetical protein